MRRLPILVILAVLLATSAVPASAGQSDNPFVGSWEGIYLDDSNDIGELLGERDLRFRIGSGQGHIQGTANPTGICYGLFDAIMRSSSFGWGRDHQRGPVHLRGVLGCLLPHRARQAIGVRGFPCRVPI